MVVRSFISFAKLFGQKETKQCTVMLNCFLPQKAAHAKFEKAETFVNWKDPIEGNVKGILL